MELTEDYENLRKFRLDGDGHRPQKRNPEREVGLAELDQGKLSPRVLYTALGLCILLSVLTLIIAVILMMQMWSETKRLDAGFQEELSNWKSKNREVNNTIMELQSEISHLWSNREVNNTIMELQSEISHLWSNLSLVQSISQWKLFKQSLYYFATNKITWDKAQEICAFMGAKLVVIKSGDVKVLEEW
ncbi:C-type lectin domain family 4 member G-like isoform X2 [Narcine bancroftii]|uniref:C-type lectin domain family 4 member G-like isoform X2 n=1 Tax=Narcine bancroftii TaxID=1343680 RepID=UPI0038315F48